ncbi:hypothetical protein E4631_11405 [Hymenobacter sp. UV11]|uniref:hypothetical protein n=1 Tax=Hymenobacter sp. UV11 TaxID=1849735 RepID=UPI00105DDF3C|nr:hypothetical protein [Hymenobacter sp. UV11]TDN40388.1 hypothetical protein A8B98_13150 [Hymenobacter sp. UV11]TFZ66610.1 hypothetical protein E4631_11405 [Hymenobacter sp. UV11]
MVKAAFFACLLALLATAAPAATARPATWPFWLSKPERHGQRKLAGDFTHHYGTYRNHSRQDGGSPLSFLHGNGHSTARHKGQLHHKSSRRRTSGLF